MVAPQRIICPLLLALAVALVAPKAHGFVSPAHNLSKDHQLTTNKQATSDYTNAPTFKQIPRGGFSETALNMAPPSVAGIIENMLVPALKSGPYGVLAITAVAATAVIPLTLYRQLYSISVGYGLAICLLYTSPSPRDQRGSRMPSSA